MPRPCKRRRICSMPKNCGLLPSVTDEKTEAVIMTVDEYETIRLIDLENMSQEECSVSMGVARTTAQAIYNSARKKLADCLVNGRELIVRGGDYVLCDGTASGCRCPKGRCHRFNNKPEGKDITTEVFDMKIAVTYENGEIFQHFGHTEQFKIYTVEDKEVKSSEVVDTNGSGHGALAQFLCDKGVNVLICGGIGGGAKIALADAGITLLGGVSGNADEAVKQYINGSIVYNPDIECAHHGEHHHGEHHHEGHSCGSHGCGEHSCH
ncbi:MAG: DUF134 domain-containing protein [Clostridia bacterium]|nr:DUF134 domain-containing protein [Clostridia bacterium]